MISGATAAMGGIIFASQVNSVALTFPPGNLLLNAIASAVIGGVSLFGGRGEVRGALLGAVLIGTLQNGLNTLQRVERLDLHHHRPRAPRRRDARHGRRSPPGPLRPLAQHGLARVGLAASALFVARGRDSPVPVTEREPRDRGAEFPAGGDVHRELRACVRSEVAVATTRRRGELGEHGVRRGRVCGRR